MSREMSTDMSSSVVCEHRRLRSWTMSLLVIVVLTVASTSSNGQSSEFLKAEVALERVLSSMSSALDFMATEHAQINLDAVIGLRMAEGQLQVLLNNILSRDSSHLSQDAVTWISKVMEEAGAISDRTLPYIQQNQPDYYKHIGFIIQKDFWIQDYPSADLDLSHVQRPLVDGEVMTEAESDKCLEELRTDQKSTNYECEVSLKCWDQMTSPGYRYYSLSHEVFYLQIGEATTCFKKNFLRLVEPLQSKFCASMLVEAESFAAHNYPKEKRDIFMEHAALCGIYGYRQFFNDDWLENILSWQRLPRGCWDVSKPGRQKREGRVLPDGCECHHTAVALGALTQYVRYIVDYMRQLDG